jgi:hypothetical protein
VAVSQKILCCLLFFALAGIITLVFTGVAGESAKILIFAAVFPALLLIFFFCFKIRRDSAQKTPEISLSESPEHEKPEKIEAVSTDSTSTDMVSTDMMSTDSTPADAVPVEALPGLNGGFMFGQPFALTAGNPELLQGAESEVVYEKNGIHYINSNVFADDERREEIDHNFAKLVESVVNKKELILE